MILKYTDTLQKVCNLKTKPEPWLHAAIVQISKGYLDTKNSKVVQPRYAIAVYVWDTRSVLEIDEFEMSSLQSLSHLTKANDSRYPLHLKIRGESQNLELINSKLMHK
jgi:hypothetical protein